MKASSRFFDAIFHFALIAAIAALITVMILMVAAKTAIAQPMRSTRGESEFNRAGERSFESEFPSEPPRPTKSSGVEGQDIELLPDAKLPNPMPAPNAPVVGRDQKNFELEQTEAEQEQEQNSATKFMTARLNPFTSLLGLIYADAGFAFKEKWMVGPALRIAKYNLLFVKEDSLGLGVRIAWYNRGQFRNSFYVVSTPLYSWGEASSKAFSASAAADFNRFYMDLIGGYQWHWQSFNFGLGVGVAYNSVTLTNLSGQAGNLKGDIPTFGFTSAAGIFPTGELTLGWSF